MPPPEDRMTAREKGTEERREREREGEHEGVLGEDKHLWGSQLLNNSERDSQHSVQRRSTVRSAHSLQRRGSKDCTERGRADKDSMREEDITVVEFLPVCACICTFVYVCVCVCRHWVHLCVSV